MLVVLISYFQYAGMLGSEVGSMHSAPMDFDL